ncbi:MAG: tRNA lysidine(34) synthetase TilS, partial [Muribaculaceae bacterium]|nr:tRNA lysidine(34) synthetase TilS [Muribaculaceae bacterium]
MAEHGLLHRHAPVLVALSGGADSVALLAVLLRLGYDCRAAHCNFHLRGEESRRDMLHCRDICRKLDADLYVRDFDVAARRRDYPGESVEMACRELRYAWFADLLDRDCAQAVAVGHHREDRAETFMLNLMRGAGIAGLTSMRPRSGNVVRPLLPFTRAEIEDYLAWRGLECFTDSRASSDVRRRRRRRPPESGSYTHLRA